MTKKDDVLKDGYEWVEDIDHGHWSLSSGYLKHQDMLQACCDPLAQLEDDDFPDVEHGDAPGTDGSRGSHWSVDVDEAERLVWSCGHYEEKTRSRMMWLGRVVVVAGAVVGYFLAGIL